VAKIVQNAAKSAKIQVLCEIGLEKPRFLENVFAFSGFLGFSFFGFNVRRLIQNYDTEIYEEYLINDTPFRLPHHL